MESGLAVLVLEFRELLTVLRSPAQYFFLKTPPTPPLGATSAGPAGKPAWMAMEHEGDRIGRYKLLQEIGEGGFGSVWMAEQVEPVTRRVALKIIKLGMDTREVVTRFEAERQALAMMDHPNIAKVFDAGTTDNGRPFFVMELVKGVPLTTYCDDRQLGTRERLGLFADVCAAIQHAHQKGIIHRDIKPSNIMVTIIGDKPVVKVIDFGIAKAVEGRLTDKTMFTRFEHFIGTPVYMSPEQADPCVMDVDTRSDIYALGILLYELLVGRPPFDAKSLASAGYEEIRRIIREVEPVKPSSRLSTVTDDERTQLARTRRIEPAMLHRLVEADLDWIVMKAIEKERSRRYDSASALAQDIAHFLADEAVGARPPSAAYQFRKFARRHKAALRIAAAFVVVLMTATVISVWQAVRATRERDEKEAARKDAEAITSLLINVFESPDPLREGRAITVAETLDRAVKKLDTDLASQPDQRAKLQVALGSTYRTLGLPLDAVPLLEQARDHLLRTKGESDPESLRAMTALAHAYDNAGRVDEALKLRETVLRVQRETAGPENLATIAAMHNLAVSFQSMGRSEEGLKLNEEVLALRRKQLGPEHGDTLSTMTNLANCMQLLGRRDEALKLREQVLAAHRKAFGVNHPGTIGAMVNLARSHQSPRGIALSKTAVSRNEQAIKLLEEALQAAREVHGPEHPATLRVTGNLATSYEDAKRNEEARALREESFRLRRKALGPLHEETLMAMRNLAVSCDALGRDDEALKLREEALQLCRQGLGDEHVRTLHAMNDLVDSYMKAGRIPEAITLQEPALATMRRVLPPSDLDFSVALRHLVDCYDKTGRKEEAAKLRVELKDAWRQYRESGK